MNDRKLAILVIFVFSLANCRTTTDTSVRQSAGKTGALAGDNITSGAIMGDVIAFENATPFTVNIVRGTGRTDICTLNPFATETVANDFNETETYYPVFDVALTNSFSVRNLHPADKNVFYQIDNNVKNQKIIITAPVAFDDKFTYIIVSNNSKSGGVSISNKPPNRLLRSDVSAIKDNLHAGETGVFAINTNVTNDMAVVSPAHINFPPLAYKVAHVYYFTFDGKTIALADARPLAKIGEKGWVKEITSAEKPPFGIYADANIEINGVASLGNDFLLYGSDKENSDAREPVIQKRTESGGLVWSVKPAAQKDSRYAYITSCAGNTKNNTFLGGGAADMQGIFYENYAAYLLAFDQNGKALWQCGPDDFDKLRPGERPNCGRILSVAYDKKNDLWHFCGELLDETGAFAGTIKSSGQKDSLHIETSFDDFLFFKILAAEDGAYYLCGRETKPNGAMQAIVKKYNANNVLLWQTANQIAAPSWHQTALLDGENKQIVVGGSLNGKPFLQGIDIESGKETWFALLNDPEFAKTELVAEIVRAPDYGFIVSLCALDDGEKAKPFIVARVNERGR
jgi:hypothetical protein